MQAFDQLKSQFALPNFNFLLNAYNTQFGISPLTSHQSDIESFLWDNALKKHNQVFITPYSHVHRGLEGLRTFWLSELSELDNEDCEDIWDYTFSHLVSYRYRLVYCKILHKYHFTPSRLHKIYPNCPLWCWHCQADPDNYLHMIWCCPPYVYAGRESYGLSRT